MSSGDVDKFIKLLAQTDGRDKIYKVLAGVSKILGYHYAADKVIGKKYNTLSKSIGEGRSLMRMGKWVGNYNKLKGYSGKVATLTAKQVVEILRVIGDFGYIFGDNAQYLCKYGVVPFNQKATQRKSKVFQFWGYVCAIILDILNLQKAMKNSDAATAKKEKKAAILSFIKNFCDFLNTLAAVGYLSNIYKPTAGFLGACGATSGAIATYSNWNKLK